MVQGVIRLAPNYISVLLLCIDSSIWTLASKDGPMRFSSWKLTFTKTHHYGNPKFAECLLVCREHSSGHSANSGSSRAVKENAWQTINAPQQSKLCRVSFIDTRQRLVCRVSPRVRSAKNVHVHSMCTSAAVNSLPSVR